MQTYAEHDDMIFHQLAVVMWVKSLSQLRRPSARQWPRDGRRRSNATSPWRRCGTWWRWFTPDVPTRTDAFVCTCESILICDNLRRSWTCCPATSGSNVQATSAFRRPGSPRHNWTFLALKTAWTSFLQRPGRVCTSCSVEQRRGIFW